MYSGTFIQPGTASGRSGGIECGRLAGVRSVGSYSWEREQGTGSVSIITGSMPEDQCMAADTGDQVYERSCIFSQSPGEADVCVQYRKCIYKVSEGGENQPERNAAFPET